MWYFNYKRTITKNKPLKYSDRMQSKFSPRVTNVNLAAGLFLLIAPSRQYTHCADISCVWTFSLCGSSARSHASTVYVCSWGSFIKLCDMHGFFTQFEIFWTQGYVPLSQFVPLHVNTCLFALPYILSMTLYAIIQWLKFSLCSFWTQTEFVILTLWQPFCFVVF